MHALRLKQSPKGSTFQHQPRSDDESIDELAGEALLNNLPKQLTKAESLRNELIVEGLSRPKSNRSFHTANEDPQNPISPSASRKTNPSSRTDKARPALAPKTTNLKTSIQKGGSRVQKTKISSPILESSTISVVNDHSKSLTDKPTKATFSLKPATNDPATLNRKIAQLMQQAAIQEAESQCKASVLKSELAKPSPHQRAKRVMVKASRAVKDKLRSGTEVRRPSTSGNVNSSRSAGLSFRSSLNEKVERSDSLKRRIAEGVNLSNPKIQSMTGKADIPKKPLPIYESMKRKMQSAPSSEDPFLDGSDSGRTSPALEPWFQKHDQFIAESAHSHDHDSIDIVKLAASQSGRTNSQQEQGRTSKIDTRFSPKISGLAQHADTLSFSSSPEATSTPQSKWHSPPAGVHKQSQSMPARNTPEEASAGLPSGQAFSTPSPASKTVNEGSLSVKRKSARHNLRSPSIPISKKLRVSRHRSHESAIKLASGFSNLVSSDEEHFSLSPKAVRSNQPRQPHAVKKKDLHTFDVGKDKAAETQMDEQPVIQKPQVRGSKRALCSRPSSVLFRRDSKISAKGKFTKLEDEDNMEIDELA